MSKFERSYFINRTLCSVLEDMRTADKNKNYSYFLAMIDEAQYLANRMEASLGDLKDVRALKEERAKLKEEVMKLRKEKKDSN